MKSNIVFQFEDDDVVCLLNEYGDIVFTGSYKEAQEYMTDLDGYFEVSLLPDLSNIDDSMF